MKKSFYCYGMALALAFTACSVDKDDKDDDEIAPGQVKVLEYCPAPVSSSMSTGSLRLWRKQMPGRKVA